MTPIIRHHFNWKRINSFGVITCEPDGSDPELLLRWQHEPVNKESVIDFLTALADEIDDPLVLLWDGLPAHRSKVVKEHIESQSDWLTVERLPAYAPELNPVEYLWSALKGKDLANFCADSINQVGDKLQAGAERIANDATILYGFLEGSTLFENITPVSEKPETL